MASCLPNACNTNDSTYPPSTHTTNQYNKFHLSNAIIIIIIMYKGTYCRISTEMDRMMFEWKTPFDS